MAADGYFLELDGIPGESQDARHRDEIELESFGWAETHAAGPGGGAAAGKVAIHDLHFRARVSNASPLLLLACASGRHLKQATLTARKAGAAQQDYFVVTLSDVLVSAYAVAGAEGDLAPVDQVSLSFARIELEYRPQKPDGSLGAPVKAGWDVKANKAL